MYHRTYLSKLHEKVGAALEQELTGHSVGDSGAVLDPSVVELLDVLRHGIQARAEVLRQYVRTTL
jgi:hypothetical protein